MRYIYTSFLLLFTICTFSQTTQQLKDSARKFPVMPNSTTGLIPFVNGLPTFASGGPFNDIEFTAFDTDYMDGENSGGDYFMPVDPADNFPGANKVKYIRCVLNTDLDVAYQSAKADRIVLGTHEIAVPFFTRGADGIDNDYVVIQHLDFRVGAIQLKGTAADYKLIYCTLADGCKTEGWYLFYTANNNIDLIAFIFPCWIIEPSVSGNPPNNANPLCNNDSLLNLNNTNQFVFATPISQTKAINGVIQFGSKGKEIPGGITVDAQGYIYTYGLTDGNIDNKTDAENEIFITKISPTGQVIWVTEMATKEGTMLKDAITDNDFIYVCGRTLGNIPGFTNAGRWDGIILKLQLTDGQIVATNQWGNPGIDGYGCITQDDAGNIFVSAQGSPPGNATTDADYLVAKHSKQDLSNVWRVIEPTNATTFAASAEAWGGLTYVAGSTAGNGKLIVAGWYFANTGANAFASVYENLNRTSPTRPHSIILATPGTRADWFLDNTVDKNGNIYFAGFTTGNLQGNHLGEGDAFIAKYSPQLTNPVFKQFGTNKGDLIRKLEIDADGNLYAVGFTYGNYAGNNADNSQKSGDVIIQKFDANLNALQKIQFGTPYEDRGYSFLKNDILYIGGITEGAMTDVNKGSLDVFVTTVNKNTLQFIQPTLTTNNNIVPSTSNGISIFPNPSTQKIFVQGLNTTFSSYAIYNNIGQLMQTGKNISNSNNSIDVSNFKTGMYTIRLLHNSTSHSYTFLKGN